MYIESGLGDCRHPPENLLKSGHVRKESDLLESCRAISSTPTSGGRGAQSWDAAGSVVSLAELGQYAWQLSLVTANLVNFEYRIHRRCENEHEALIDDDTQEELKAYLIGFRVICNSLDLDSAIPKIDRIYHNLRSGPCNALATTGELRELRERIDDQCKQRWFVYVPPRLVDYFGKRDLFGSAVAGRFPSAGDDIENAGNCLAVSQPTAVVHHCMGIMQVGLTAVARNLGCTVDLYVDTWDQIIQKIEGAVKARSASVKPKSRWKRQEPFYSEIVSDLRAVKNAWRNPTAHFRRTYNETQALKVLEKVRDFMQNLTTRLRER